MVIQSVIEHSDLDRTRRSLYIASFYTIIVANADITGEYLEIFQLQVRFVQSDLVALGRLAVAILLGIFLLHTLTQVFSKTSGLARDWFDRWEKTAHSEIYKMEQSGLEDNSDRGPSKLEIHYGNEGEKKSRLVSHFIRSEILFGTFKDGLLKFIFVTFLSIYAFCSPHSVNTVLDTFRVSEAPPKVKETSP